MQLDLEIANEQDSSLDINERQIEIDEAMEIFSKTIRIAKDVQTFLLQ